MTIAYDRVFACEKAVRMLLSDMPMNLGLFAESGNTFRHQFENLGLGYANKFFRPILDELEKEFKERAVAKLIEYIDNEKESATAELARMIARVQNAGSAKEGAE